MSPSTVSYEPATALLTGTLLTSLQVSDQIFLYLPSQMKVLATKSNLTCSIISPPSISISTCSSNSSTNSVKVVLSVALSSQLFQLQISNAFINPSTTQQTSSFYFLTYRPSTNTILDSQNSSITVTGTAASLKALSVEVSTGSSAVVGQQTTLAFSLTTANSIPMGGNIQVVFPYYFNISTSNVYQHMINQTAGALQCYNSSSLLSVACSYNPSNLSVTVSNLFPSSSQAAGSSFILQIQGVLNPISTATGASITVMTSDGAGGIIDKSLVTYYASSGATIVGGYEQTSDTYIVQESAAYQIDFAVPIPMRAGCLITLQFPWPDYDYSNFQSISLQGFGMFGVLRFLAFTYDSVFNSITITNGCVSDINVESLPDAYILIDGISNPMTTKQSGMLQIIVEDANGGVIATYYNSSGGDSGGIQCVNGSVTSGSASFNSTTINSNAYLTLSFTPAHALSGISQLVLTFNSNSFSLPKALFITSTSISNISQASISTPSSYSIQISNFYASFTGDSPLSLKVGPLTLSGSVQSFGSIQVDTYMQVTSTTSYYLVDSGTISSQQAINSGIFTILNVSPQSSKANQVTTYTFSIMATDPIPSLGYLQIIFPLQVTISSFLSCSYNAVKSICNESTSSNTLNLSGPFMNSSFPADTLLSFTVSNIQVSLNEFICLQNPRSLQPSSSFGFSTLTTFGDLIDNTTSNDTIGVTMTSVPSFSTALIQSVSSYSVGTANSNITFLFASPTTLISGDILQIVLPSEITLPQLTLCLVSPPTASCSLTQSAVITMVLTMSSLQAGQQFTVQLGGFTNPASGKPTASFNFSLYDSSLYLINSYFLASSTLQMTQPYLITDNSSSIEHDNAIPFYPTTVTINFINTHSIPSAGQIWITYPSEMSMNSSILNVSLSTTNSQIKFSYVSSQRTIKITSGISYTLAYSTTSIYITGLINSKASSATSSFIIQSFTEGGYVIDEVTQGLSLVNDCSYPCQSCSGSPISCTSCLPEIYNSNYLLEGDQCVAQCSSILGYYTETNQYQSSCQLCDSPCATCDRNPTNCTSCTANLLLRPVGGVCSDSCPTGYYADIKAGKCFECTGNCAECEGASGNCTSCNAGTFLLDNKCESECPSDEGFIENYSQGTCDNCSVGGCLTCQGSITNCTSCGTGLLLDITERTCISECPADVSADQGDGMCTPCNASCLTCEATNASLCTSCSFGLYYDPSSETCLYACPASMTALPYYASSNASSVLIQDSMTGVCKACDQGCSECYGGNTSLCTSCQSDQGYFSFNASSCVKACPYGYTANTTSMMCDDDSLRCPYGYSVKISSAGYDCVLASVLCESGYVLNSLLNACIPTYSFYIPFPNLSLMVLLSLILVIIVKARPYTDTNLITSLIIIWSLIEILIYWQQMILAFLYNQWTVSSLTLTSIITHYLLNAGAKFYMVRKQNKDAAFKHWILAYPKTH